MYLSLYIKLVLYFFVIFLYDLKIILFLIIVGSKEYVYFFVFLLIKLISVLLKLILYLFKW